MDDASFSSDSECDDVIPARVVPCSGKPLLKLVDTRTGTWPNKTDVACWWCCHNFDTVPCPLPVSYNAKRKFVVKGCFCSFNCAKAYNSREGGSNKDVINHLLFSMTQKLWYAMRKGVPFPGVVAAPPRTCLKMFGGYMDIDTFRAESAARVHMVKEPPFMLEFVHQNDFVASVDMSGLSREALAVVIGTMMTPEQRSSVIKHGDAPGLIDAIPWKEIGTQVNAVEGCDERCLLGLLHLMVNLLSVDGGHKAKVLRDNIRLLANAALTTPAAWDVIASMGDTNYDALGSVLRGMLDSASVDEAKNSVGGRDAVRFLDDGHRTRQSVVGAGVCTGAVCGRHTTRSKRVHSFLKSNRSRVYANGEPGSDDDDHLAHAVQSALLNPLPKTKKRPRRKKTATALLYDYADTEALNHLLQTATGATSMCV
eukprot:jgi/Mesvir1/11579/Mv04341-RA.1